MPGNLINPYISFPRGGVANGAYRFEPSNPVDGTDWKNNVAGDPISADNGSFLVLRNEVIQSSVNQWAPEVPPGINTNPTVDAIYQLWYDATLQGVDKHDGDFTISAWVWPDDNPADGAQGGTFYIMSKAGGSTIVGPNYSGSSNDLHWTWIMRGQNLTDPLSLSFTFWGTQSGIGLYRVYSVETLNLEEWNHVVLKYTRDNTLSAVSTYDPAVTPQRVEFYVNGVRSDIKVETNSIGTGSSTQIPTGGQFQAGSHVCIGGRAGGTPWSYPPKGDASGYMADIRAFSDALSDSEISDIYTLQDQYVNHSSLEAWWLIDPDVDGSGYPIGIDYARDLPIGQTNEGYSPLGYDGVVGSNTSNFENIYQPVTYFANVGPFN